MKTYALLDSGGFRKLEQVGPFRIVRPSLSAVWEPLLSADEWRKVDAEFKRYKDGDGEWVVKNDEIKKPWVIAMGEIVFQIKLTGFGHLGIFAEQNQNWTEITELIRSRKKSEAPFRVLNLFAYTGGSTLAAALGGAQVVHLDASKSSVAWARKNAELSKLQDRPVRWIIDDAQEFVDKELRRGSQYDGFILDPPSYGRGQKNQVWKIEEHMMPLLKKLAQLASERVGFVLLSSHSPGYTPLSLQNQLQQTFSQALARRQAQFNSQEMVIFDKAKRPLPSGAYSFLKWNEQ